MASQLLERMPTSPLSFKAKVGSGVKEGRSGLPMKG